MERFKKIYQQGKIDVVEIWVDTAYQDRESKKISCFLRLFLAIFIFRWCGK